MIDPEMARRVGMPSDRSAPLAIHLFGPFEVRLHGQPLPRLRSRKGQWLLALLTLRHGGLGAGARPRRCAAGIGTGSWR